MLDSFPGGGLSGGRGRAVITASSAVEYAFEGDQLADDHEPQPSVFTSALVDGLVTGDADRDQDGWVSLSELYDYVFDRVRELNPHQTPSRDVEMQGELYVARRSRPVTTPAPLPPDLQGVIDHPLANVRAGAVQELARLGRGSHAGLALAARLTLESLADDDSRIVAAAAATALVTIDQDQGETPVTSSTEALPEAPASPRVRNDQISAAVSPSGPSAGGRPQRPIGQRFTSAIQQHRLIYAAGAVVVLAAAAVATALMLKDHSAPQGGGHLQEEEFTATSPWRLVIRDNASGADAGCEVTVTNVESGKQVAAAKGIHQSMSFQLQETGRFRWKANDPACQVFLNPGSGQTVLPFVHDGGGDTDAFDAGGSVAVNVVNFGGNPECKFVLHDAADGRQLDVGSVRPGGGTLRLDPGGQSHVYLTNAYCGVRVSDG